MKRSILLLSCMTMITPALAQEVVHEARGDMRVHSTLEAATPGGSLPGQSATLSEAKTTSTDVESSATSQPVPEPVETSRLVNRDHRTTTGAVPRSCRDLRSEIERKIRNNGVSRFTLNVVIADAMSRAQRSGDEIVGHCDTGRYKIVYRKDG